MEQAVLIHTVRGGKDPENHWTAVTAGLADCLDPDDPWRDLGTYLDAEDPRILASFETQRAAKRACAGRNIAYTLDAVGY